MCNYCKGLEKTERDFFHAYLTCALWSSTDDNGTPLDSEENAGAWVSKPTAERMIDDCKKFLASADLTDYPIERAGHDFWLTRNGHGAGFWDNDLGTVEQCEKLTQLSKSFGEFNLMIEDGEIFN